ncbi:MAG: NUDIX domain-containing protein [Bacteroidetes bacterium]|nr:NUDIX domain-containing protein [Bacteroidota bacterium]
MDVINFKILLSSYLVFTFLSGIALAGNSGAGGVLYTNIQGSTYVLLADHRKKNRGWASFGGRLDQQSPMEAAAREIEEETNGLIKRDWVIKQLPDSLSYTVTKKSSLYTMYFLEIPFVPAVQFTSTKVPKNKKGFDERGPYSWVPIEVLENAIKEYQAGNTKVPMPGEYLPSSKKTTWFWKKFLSSIDKAKRNGVSPWATE